MRYSNIMLVDDDDDDREIFLSALKEVSPQLPCSTAVNGRQALDQLLASEVKPDLIFLDLNMPLMNGRDFLRALKSQQQQADIPVIIFSTSSDPATVRETRELGAAHFITKPDKFDQLREILREVLWKAPKLL